MSVIRIIQYTIIVSSDRIDTLKEFDKKGLHTRYTRDTQIDIVLTGHFCLVLYKNTVYVKTRLTEYTTIVSSDRFDTLYETEKNMDTHLYTICVLNGH